jgi:hypothetical protein
MNQQGMPYIYIASPYAIGDQEENVNKSLEIAEAIVRMNAIPVVPLLTHWWDKKYPHPHSYWIQYTLQLVELCDGMLRVAGESKGADGEVARALELGMPVVYSLEELDQLINSGYFSKKDKHNDERILSTKVLGEIEFAIHQYFPNCHVELYKKDNELFHKWIMQIDVTDMDASANTDFVLARLNRFDKEYWLTMPREIHDRLMVTIGYRDELNNNELEYEPCG